MKMQILYEDDARRALEKGISTVSEAVAVTIGPKGRNVVLAKTLQSPQIINDGVTIAKEIYLQDSVQNMGALLVKEAASKTNAIAGDGTTTSTILAYSIIQQGLKYLSSGIDAISLKKGITKSVNFVIDQILECARPVQNSLDMIQIASISANNDTVIGQIIAEAFSQAGREGIISLEEGNSTFTELEIMEGMQFEKGFMSPYFSSDKDTMSATKQNPYLLLTDQTLSSIQKEIIPILEIAIKAKKPLIIIAKDIEQKALATLVMNKLKNKIDIIAVKAPGFGAEVNNFLEDMCTLTDGILISKESGIRFNNLKIEMFGRARQVTVDKNITTIIADRNKAAVENRCIALRKQIESSDSFYEKEKLESRLAKLSGGVSVIKIGAATEIEMREKKLRFEDAINATKAAIAEGIIPGGGSTLAHTSIRLQEWARKSLRGDEQIGALIIAIAIAMPLKRIASNSGENGAFILNQLGKYPSNIGYNAIDNTFNDLFDIGVIDPVKVTRSALQNAASVASMILTTECVVPE